jgi:hypothetical protein
MRRFTLVLTLVLLVLAMSGVADAVVFNARVTGGAGFEEIVRVEGAIKCSAGQTFIVKVAVRQDGLTVGNGRANGTCTGRAQGWITGQERTFNGGIDCTQPWAATGIARTSDGHSFNIPSTPFGPIC